MPLKQTERMHCKRPNRGNCAMGLILLHHSPSYSINAPKDFLQSPQPLLQDRFPSDHLWPSNPPRGDVYCDTLDLLHPLVSPCTASSHLWSADLPPMWFAYGEEQLVDDGRCIAQRLLANGHQRVHFLEYEGLPHIWAFLLPEFPQTQRVFRKWAAFMEMCVGHDDGVKTSMVRYLGTDCVECPRSGEVLFPYSHEEVLSMMRKKRDERRPWVGSTSSKM